jgi:SAM-dependent methyltransferase
MQYPLLTGLSLDGTDLSFGQNGDNPFQAFSGDRMNPSSRNRFEDFFAADAYISLKNLLYNYLLRKRAIINCKQGSEGDLILEVGSGLSPMMINEDNVVYSELSFSALRTLMKCQRKGFYVTADAMHLPFKSGSFPWVICSEVLEHLPNDLSALQEISAVMKRGGSLILTFPHRHCYFARDDRYVSHLRRYELSEMEDLLREAGLNPVAVQKVLGPLEKITMILCISVITIMQRIIHVQNDTTIPPWAWNLIIPIFKWTNYLFSLLIWLDARISPRIFSAVLLIRAIKL